MSSGFAHPYTFVMLALKHVLIMGSLAMLSICWGMDDTDQESQI